MQHHSNVFNSILKSKIAGLTDIFALMDFFVVNIQFIKLCFFKADVTILLGKVFDFEVSA